MLQTLHAHQQAQNRQGFGEVLAQFWPQIRAYVAERLRWLEREGILPPGRYAVEDIVDEAYLQLFERFDVATWDERRLRIALFQAVEDRLAAAMAETAETADTLSIEALVAEELKTLEERITADAEGEVVFVEELDDISYHLDDARPRVWLLDEAAEERLLAALALEREWTRDQHGRQRLALVYRQLPATTRTLLMLQTHGGLSLEEAAAVTGMTVQQARMLQDAARQCFSRVLAGGEAGSV